MSYKNLTIIVPVREGSTRIKEKIHLPFTAKYSLLEWKINQLKKISPEINILISSNSDNIKKIAKNLNVDYHDRGDYLSVGHNASFSEVIMGIVKDIKTEHFAWVTVVVPLMSPNEYKEGFDLYFEHVVNLKNYDSLVSVNLLKEYFWDEEKPINYEATRNHTISQNLPNIYRVTNGLYMSSKKQTLDNGYFLGNKPFKHQVCKIAGIDIDENEDYIIAKSLLKYYNELNK